MSPFTLERIVSIQTLFIRALENQELENISCTESCRAIFNMLLFMGGAPKGGADFACNAHLSYRRKTRKR
jgi:hypothetical protein